MVDLCLNFMKIEWVMTSLLRYLTFLQTIVHMQLHFLKVVVIFSGDQSERQKKEYE